MLLRWILIGLVASAWSGMVRAQGPPPVLAWEHASSRYSLPVASDTASLDYQLLYRWYTQNDRFTTNWMWRTDRTAYPVFYGSPLLIWGLVAVDGVEAKTAYRFSVAHLSTVGGTFVLKQLFKRQRPYVRHEQIVARRTSDIDLVERPDPHSFPSGHTALAVAVATSLSLEHPKPYVIIPSAVWAGSVGLSRMWLGLHYPSDVVLGALMGGGIAWVIHAFGNHIIPGQLR
ncbi:MAG: phosphatase PAP2 family protein [Rhodothermales bacterium]